MPKTVEPVREWIKFADRIPEKDGRYFVVEENHYHWVGVSSFRNGKFDTKVIYWMELPKAPEKEITNNIEEES